MYSIRKKLSIIILICSIMATMITFLFVNFTINYKFNKYMVDTQNKRNERLVQYFKEIYKRDKKWTENSGVEMRHEAYMSNYCLSLLDKDKILIWTMNPDDIKAKDHMAIMRSESDGVYNSNDFPIKYEDKIVGYVRIGQYSSVLMSKEDLNFKNSVNKGIGISIFITLIIVILISLRISKQFSRPIRGVSNVSVCLSGGDYSARYTEVTDIVELENLKNSINSLGEKLKQQEQLRKRLVSDISHEIRTPLNILQNNLEAMIDGIFPITSQGLVSLNEEVIRFSKLLDNLNVLKEVETEEEKGLLNKEKFSLEQLLTSVCEDFSLLLKEKNIELIFNVRPNKDYEIMGDINKLKQVFINLLSNAMKFTREQGKIWVNLTDDPNGIIVRIRDNGMGISEEDLPFIFERLYRGDKSRNKIEGSGIGLTIVKNILIMHSASIQVESELGKGAVFTIHFTM